MLTLRITQIVVGNNTYGAEIALEGNDLVRRTATVRFSFVLDEHDQDQIAWYLEEYPQNPIDPTPKVAARIQRRMREIGEDLFRAVFEEDDDARDLWAQARDQLTDTRVELVTGVGDATAIPWELIRDPRTDAPLALGAAAFVRAHPQPSHRPIPLKRDAGPVRILLIICRPGGGRDVPFRSVASRIVKGLRDDVRANFRLEVLRPPTFDQLSRKLTEAKQRGEPYHVVHFDGHGTYLDPRSVSGRTGDFNPLLFGDDRTGKHGYLVFENDAAPDNCEYVGGPALGKLLAESDVPVLVLNACRSAHAEADDAPEKQHDGGTKPEADLHARVRAFGSLAQEVMDAGVAGVVAMRYNIYVVSAAQFVADLYGALLRGQTLGEAVTFGRKQLNAAPLREIAERVVELQDWVVPVAYESSPLALFPHQESVAPRITLHSRDATPAGPGLPANLPMPPDIGFFGRDETLLELDRAFDSQRVVLLHGYAGSGKTATAVEFARWYALTGGVTGPVLFTSFADRHRTLTQVLDEQEPMLGTANAARPWLTLSDAEKRAAALEVLRKLPVLWVWDNVEPIAGFFSGTPSRWMPEEQQELADFLRAAQQTQAKFLLTSRRDERGWLGNDLPYRISMPPMPMRERIQFARALAERHGQRLNDPDDWRPLLRFTEGNPLTITVVVGQALRARLHSRQEIEDFVAQLRGGDASLDDDEREGRTRSLGASLRYGFEHAFTEAEREVLAHLHLFQGYVTAGVLSRVLNSDDACRVPGAERLTDDDVGALLHRAAEVGLLAPVLGNYYAIHPALPWYFRNLFERRYPATGGDDSSSSMQCQRAFVNEVSLWGWFLSREPLNKDKRSRVLLALEEDNLLQVRRLALRSGWWRELVHSMDGLWALYLPAARQSEWLGLVDEIAPEFFEPGSDEPRAGREKPWHRVVQYCIAGAVHKRHLALAERLSRRSVQWARELARPALAIPGTINRQEGDFDEVHALAESLMDLGEVLVERANPDCVAAFEEALRLAELRGDRSQVARITYQLGHAYKDISAIRDFDKAQTWYQLSLEHRDAEDQAGRGNCLQQMSVLGLERFKTVMSGGGRFEDAMPYLEAARQFMEESLRVFPLEQRPTRSRISEHLAMIYLYSAQPDIALAFFADDLRRKEVLGDVFAAAVCRQNMAFALCIINRPTDALAYAEAALRDFQTFDRSAAADIQKTRELISELEAGLTGARN
jgi:hypothetical protein